MIYVQCLIRVWLRKSQSMQVDQVFFHHAWKPFIKLMQIRVYTRLIALLTIQCTLIYNNFHEWRAFILSKWHSIELFCILKPLSHQGGFLTAFKRHRTPWASPITRWWEPRSGVVVRLPKQRNKVPYSVTRVPRTLWIDGDFMEIVRRF